jgi:hypothetical protein
MNKVGYSGTAFVAFIQVVDFIAEHLFLAGAAIKCTISNTMNQCYIAGVAPITIPFVVITFQVEFHDILLK